MSIHVDRYVARRNYAATCEQRKSNIKASPSLDKLCTSKRSIICTYIVRMIGTYIYIYRYKVEMAAVFFIYIIYIIYMYSRKIEQI